VSLQTIIPGTTPPAQSLDLNPLTGVVLDPAMLDAPDPDDIVEIVPEVFCLACQAPVAAFESHGGDMMHYTGDPMNDNVIPYEADHAPFLP
jgi:hypothetical protein